jgi:hypothetical protein
MKLVNSWPEEAPAVVPLGQLYDESEEYDELDESKDGCGGVQWWKYVLKAPGTSNLKLFQLAQHVRGVEKRRGKPFTLTQYKTICTKWEDASRPFLRANENYFMNFLAKLNSVTVPGGETLWTAFERAKIKEPPSKVMGAGKDLELLASLCRELQEMAGDQPIMLCQTSIAKLFTVSQQTISERIRALKTLEVLQLVEPAVKNLRAARYYFIE